MEKSNKKDDDIDNLIYFGRVLLMAERKPSKARRRSAENAKEELRTIKLTPLGVAVITELGLRKIEEMHVVGNERMKGANMFHRLEVDSLLAGLAALEECAVSSDDKLRLAAARQVLEVELA